MDLHKTYKKAITLLMALVIALSGVNLEFGLKMGNLQLSTAQVNAAEYTTLKKTSDGSTIQIPVQTYTVDTNADGTPDTPYQYVEVTVSGEWTPPNYPRTIDIFMVGGGGGGGVYANGSSYGGGGGGGGYTKTVTAVAIAENTPINIVIGAGGAGNGDIGNGGATYVGSYSAAGGKRGNSFTGGDGGSGGGGGYLGTGTVGNGGSDGANGTSGYSSANAGKGQGTSTKDFLGRTHAAGGGGGGAASGEAVHGNGGTSTSGGPKGGDGDPAGNARSGTGGGGYGGGGGGSGWSSYTGGAGSSGFVMIRWNASQKPILSVNLPSQNQILSEADTGFIPKISVSDPEGNNLTCKYFVDAETSPRDTKTVSNTATTQSLSFNSLNMSTLSEGNHTIKYEVTDGISSPSVQTVGFKVDKTAPNISQVSVKGTSTINTISLAISGSAIDTIGGLDANPYRYTIGSTISPWGNAVSFTSAANLSSSTLYAVKFEARDKSGHIASSSQNIYTKATVPILTVSNASSYTLDVATSDSNSAATQYQVSVNSGSSYVTQEGNLTATPVWITLTGKKVSVKGLSPSTAYSFVAKARNAENIETAASSAASGTTLIAPPNSPANIFATATDKTITVSWDAVSGAVGYDVEADGTVVNNGTATSYTHSSLNPGTPHTYRIRARNAGGPGNWSSGITKSTLPGSPNIPANLNAIPLSTSITVTWNNVPGATGYDIEVDGELVSNGPNTNYVHSSLTPGTHHSYRVRSINPGGKSDWSGTVNATTLLDTVPVPVNLTAVPALNSISLSWDAVEGASGYDIEVDGISFDNSTRISFTQNGLAPGTQHIYRVRAKKGGINSEWSAAVVSSTLANTFGTPANFTAIANNTSVVLSWEPVPDAAEYDVEIDGTVRNNGSEITCVHSGLAANSNHTYRVRARNGAGTSAWSPALAVKTFLLQTPENIAAVSDQTSISVNWSAVSGATSYDVEFDGSIVSNIKGTTYAAIGLIPNSQHVIKVRAVNASGTSNWSIPLMKSTQLSTGNIPRVSGLSKKTSITVMWSPMEGVTSYDVEADGVLKANVTGSAYTLTGLAANTQHTFRVRAKNSSGTGNWSDAFQGYTLREGPAVPSNLSTSSNMTSILVTWDKVAGATEYEIETDGTKISAGAGNSYLHTGLTPDTSHTYRVRSKNVSGYSGWSNPVTVKTLSSVQTFDINSAAGEEFDLVLSAANIQDLNRYTFTIQYNSADFDVIDLCGLTPRLDTLEGDITGTDITIKQLAPGTIVFIKTGSVQSWQVWSGTVNSITLKAKHDGKATVTYTIQ